MITLPYTDANVEIIQEFLNETKERLSNGVEITFTGKASDELEELTVLYDISESDIENAILNLKVEDYYRGIDPSNRKDFDVCAFKVCLGKDHIEIYLKYGLEVAGLQILLFSNHIPDYSMDQPFKN